MASLTPRGCFEPAAWERELLLLPPALSAVAAPKPITLAGRFSTYLCENVPLNHTTYFP